MTIKATASKSSSMDIPGDMGESSGGASASEGGSMGSTTSNFIETFTLTITE